MKFRILITACLILMTCESYFCQGQNFSILEASVGHWYGLGPDVPDQMQWQSGTDNISFVEKYETLLTENIKTKAKTTILSLAAFNETLSRSKLPVLDYLSEYNWISKNLLQINVKNYLVFYNIENKAIESYITCREGGENYSYSKEIEHVAYTYNNNVWLAGKNAASFPVTKENDANFVCGKSVSRNEFGIEKGIFWSPKGNFLTFYRKDESEVSNYPLIDYDHRVANAKLIKYPMAGMPSEHISLGVFDMKSAKTIYIEQDPISEKYLTNISWDPSEKFIFIAVLNREQNHMQLNKYNVADGKFVKTLFEEKNSKYVEPLHPAFFLKSDPTKFIWQSERDGFNHLYLYDIEGNLINQITKGNWVVNDILAESKEGGTIYYTSTQESPLNNDLYQTDLKGNIKRITKKDGYHDILLNSDFQTYIDTYSYLEDPGNVSVCNFEGKQISMIRKSEDPLENYNKCKIEIFSFKANDLSTNLFGRLIKPSNFDKNKKYPLLLYVYGGPHSQQITNKWLGDASLWNYYMAQKGYLVLTIDNRGSDRRGRDFENVIHRQCGKIEMQDQITGLEYVIKQGIVDTTHICVHGWSYGGFMTTSLMLNYPQYFKAGVAGGPVMDWKYYEVMYGERYMDTPNENPAGYAGTSCIENATKLNGKLLIIHGGMDSTVVLQHSQLFINQCVNNKKQVEYFIYPADAHGVGGFRYVNLHEKITNFFDLFIKE